jgi:hypothetical protein
VRAGRGISIHGTTRMRPAVVFSAEEAPALAPVPEAVFAALAPSHETFLHTSVS